MLQHPHIPNPSQEWGDFLQALDNLLLHLCMDTMVMYAHQLLHLHQVENTVVEIT